MTHPDPERLAIGAAPDSFRPAFEPDAHAPQMPGNLSGEFGAFGQDPATFAQLAGGEVLAGEFGSADITTDQDGNSSLRVSWNDVEGKSQQQSVPLDSVSPDAIAGGWNTLFGNDPSTQRPNGAPNTTPQGTGPNTTNGPDTADELRRLREEVRRLSETVGEIRDTSATTATNTEATGRATVAGAVLTAEGVQATRDTAAATAAGLRETTDAVNGLGDTLGTKIDTGASTLKSTLEDVRDHLAEAVQSEGEEVTRRLDDLYRLIDERIPAQPDHAPALPNRYDAAPLPIPENLSMSTEQKADADDVARAWESVVASRGVLSLDAVMRVMMTRNAPERGDMSRYDKDTQAFIKFGDGTLSVKHVIGHSLYKKVFGTKADGENGVGRTQIFDPAPDITEANQAAIENASIEVIREVLRHTRTSSLEELEMAFDGQPIDPSRIARLIGSSDPADNADEIRQALIEGTATNDMLLYIMRQFGAGAIRMRLPSQHAFREAQGKTIAHNIRNTPTGQGYSDARAAAEETYRLWWEARNSSNIREGAELERPTLDEELRSLAWGARQYAGWVASARLFSSTVPRGGALREIIYPRVSIRGSAVDHASDHSTGFDSIGGYPMPRWIARRMLKNRFRAVVEDTQVLSPEYRDEIESRIRKYCRVSDGEPITKDHIAHFTEDKVNDLAYAIPGKGRVKEGYPEVLARISRKYITAALTDYLSVRED